jgi:hypothetical protein
MSMYWSVENCLTGRACVTYLTLAASPSVEIPSTSRALISMNLCNGVFGNEFEIK